MQISPLGGWLVSALPIPNAGENGTFRLLTLTLIQTHNSAPMQKQAPVHIKPTPTKQDPKQNIVCTTVCALQNIIISIVCEIKKPIKWQ
jgi:hypothetical protein